MIDNLDIPERTGDETTPGLAGQDLVKVTAKVRKVIEVLNGLSDVDLAAVVQGILANTQFTADQLPALTDSDFPALAAGLKPTLDAYYAPLPAPQTTP